MGRRVSRLSLAGVVAVALTAAGLSAGSRSAVAEPPPGASVVDGLHVDGAVLRDDGNAVVQLRGVNLMSSEYACSGGWGFVAGLDDPADRETVLDAMESWAINAVRVPLNADCWFGTKPELAGNPYVGAPYRLQMTQWINQITDRGMVAIADLHWTAPDGFLATGQASMADVDVSVPFWHELALEFGANTNVVFDLFNEPYLNREVEEGASAPGSDVTDLDAAWACWADGCTATRYDSNQSPTTGTYEVAGMQDLVDAVRAEGAANVLLVSGLQYSQYFDRLIAPTLPITDPMDNLAISFHAYPGNDCGLDDTPCRVDLADLASFHPVVVGEFGRADCTTKNVDDFLDYADAYGLSYLGWQWLPLPGIACSAGYKFELTKDALTGAPSKTGLAVMTHYLQRVTEGTGVHVATASLPNGLAGAAYKANMVATGGKTGYHWSVAGGYLPPGVKLSASGHLRGTPVRQGTWEVWIQVTDTSKPVAFVDTRSYTFVVDPMTVATTALPDGAVGTPYKAKLLAQGGKGGEKWTVDAGSLPPGVKLATAGTLSGTPTTPGSYDIVFRGTDRTKPSANTATAALTIVVAP